MPEDSPSSVSPRSIASDLLEYLRENPGVCAEGNVHGWRWVRFHAGNWQAVKYYQGADRLKDVVVGEVLDDEAVLDWLEAKPVTLIPESEAVLWTPSEQTVWDNADQQDVFTDHDRCFWCGSSERTQVLQSYQTTPNGKCQLCSDCYESWEKADEIVQPMGVHSSAE